MASTEIAGQNFISGGTTSFVSFPVVLRITEGWGSSWGRLCLIEPVHHSSFSGYNCRSYVIFSRSTIKLD